MNTYPTRAMRVIDQSVSLVMKRVTMGADGTIIKM